MMMMFVAALSLDLAPRNVHVGNPGRSAVADAMAGNRFPGPAGDLLRLLLYYTHARRISAPGDCGISLSRARAREQVINYIVK